MRARTSRVAVALMLYSLVACQVSPQGSTRSQQGATASVGSSPQASGASAPAAATPSLPPLPADVTAIADAIVDAPTPAAATAATRKALETAGVLVIDDPTKRAGSPAQMYVSETELELMATEAQRRAIVSRATFEDFAIALAGAAGLPPNPPVPLLQTGTTDVVQVKIVDQPARLAAFMTSWVNLAEKYHGSSDPAEVALTNAPLLVAALAQHQADPIDLRQAFLGSRLRLGSLDLLLLVAGLRRSIFAATRVTPASPSSSPSASPGSASPSPRATTSPSPSASPYAGSGDSPRGRGPGLAAVTTTCDALMQYLSSNSTAVSALTSFTYGEALKGYVSEFVTDLSHGTQQLEERLGVLLEVLGILARLQALVLLYSTVQVKTEVDPASLHKAIDATSTVTAKVTAGIPDAEWNRAVQGAAENPIRTQARSCAQDLGLPVLTNDLDIAAAMKNWHAEWDITKGSPEHANLPGGQFLGPGAVASRLERPMTAQGDHQATDSITVNVTPEKQSDHPGTLTDSPVTVCSKVRTDQPPDLKTLLNASVSGSGAGGMPIVGDAQKVASASEKLLGSAAIASLVATIVDLLAGFVQNVATLDSCATVKVGYHKPKPAKWSGTVHIESEMSSSARTDQSGSTRYTGRAGSFSIHSDRHSEIDTTLRLDEQFTASGDDAVVGGQVVGSVSLDAIQVADGYNAFLTSTLSEGVMGNGCLYNGATVSDYSGSFTYTSNKAHVSVLLSPDGSYMLALGGDPAPARDLTISGTDSTLVEPTGQGLVINFGGAALVPRSDCGRTNFSRAGTRPAVLLGVGPGAKLGGQIDPKHPGDRLSGSVTIFNEFDGSTSVVTWDLHHDGPIPVPSR